MSYPARLDHLVYAADDLEQAMDRIEALLGVRPAKGGVHPAFGTCNALLSLGNRVYLEILAPDPDLPAPPYGKWTDQAPKGGGLMTWVLRSDDIEGLAESARDAGGDIGKVVAGERSLDDGSTLKWLLTNPYAMPIDGAVPFLIDWGSSPHPALTAPMAGALTGLTVEHPEAAKLREIFVAMGERVEIREAAEFRLVATIQTANGSVELS